MAEGASYEINRKIIESIEKASNDIDNLNYLLIDEAAMAARIEQMSRRVQARFANFSGPDSDFLTAINSDFARAAEGMSLISELASNPHFSEIQQDVFKTVLDSANNPHRREMREAVHREYSAMAGSSNNPYGHEMREDAEKALGDMMRNPYMSEMQATAKEALSDCFSNPHWEEMQQSALHVIEDSFKNPHWEEMAAEAKNALFGYPVQSEALANVLEDTRLDPYLSSVQEESVQLVADASCNSQDRLEVDIHNPEDSIKNTDNSQYSTEVLSGNTEEKITYNEQQIGIKKLSASHNLLKVEAQLKEDSAVNKNSFFENQEAKYLKDRNKFRAEDIITDEAVFIREERIRRRWLHGSSDSNPISQVHTGLTLDYQYLTADEKFIIKRDNNNPEEKLKENLSSSVFSLPPILEMAKHALQGATNNIVDRVEEKKKRIETHNDKIDRLIARKRQMDRLADHNRYSAYRNKMQSGYNLTLEEWQEMGELRERVDEGLGAIRESEIRGRAKRLKQELKFTSSCGGKIELLATPVPGSEDKFEDTRSLDKWQRLTNAGIGTAVEIASSIVYKKPGQIVAQGVKYVEDKASQKVSQNAKAS